MKTQILRLSIAIISVLSLLSACEKQEPLAEAPKVVSLRLSGSTAEDIEFVYKDSVILSLSAADNFSQSVKVPVNNENADLQVREKGSTTIITTKSVKASPFDQNITIYYDGEEIFSQKVNYEIKGYAMSGELEFLLDGRVIHEGSSKIDKTLPILINENSTRELVLRLKGTEAPLITRTIEPSPADQSLAFFFDGVAMIDNLPELQPPSNPANMAVSAQFNPNFIGSNPPQFSGDAELDLVFYVRNSAGVVTDPNIRITIPTRDRFVNFELPPLPDAGSLYTFDICKKGTDEMPYSNFAGATLYPPQQSKGQYGEFNIGTASQKKYFEAGTSKLILLGPTFKNIRSPTRFMALYGQVVQDLSQYFE